MAARTPEECDRLFAQCTNAGDLDGLVALYEAHATLIPEPGNPVSGKEAIRAGLAGLIALKPKITMNVLRVVTAGTDLAVLYNDWSATATGPDGKPMTMAGKAIEVVRRQSDGSWLFAVDDPFARG